MSTFKVEVVPFTLHKHDNADTLSIAQIRGWQCVVRTEEFQNETLGVYVPLDAIAPADHSLLGFMEGKKVKTIKLRKVISQGILLPASLVQVYLTAQGHKTVIKEGLDLQHELGIKKWEAPFKPAKVYGINAMKRVELPDVMHRYTEIENIKNFPEVFKPEDLVHVTEKLHGTSARFGIINGKYYYASRNVGLYGEVKPTLWPRIKSLFFKERPESMNTVWTQVSNSHNIKQILRTMFNSPEYINFDAESIVVYGEIVGVGIQDLDYGFDKPTFFPYDISINGLYVNSYVFDILAKKFFGRVCPVIHSSIEFGKLNLNELSNGNSTLTDKHVREGIIIKSVEEEANFSIGRKILKSIGVDYYMRKGATDN